MVEKAVQALEEILPSDFPEEIHASVIGAMKSRLNGI